jgi:SNF2 family DNA or RNA helicase
MARLLAELTGDGQSIFLLGDGNPEALATWASWCGTLTPLVKPVDDGGALTLPASWPAMVQLMSTFPDLDVQPRLAAWTANQASYRAAAEALTPLDFHPHALTYTPPAALTPYPWQVTAGHITSLMGRLLLTDEPGTGKTASAILGICEYAAVRSLTPAQLGPVVCIVPASVVDAWVEAWEDWAPGYVAIAWRGTVARRRALAGTAHVYVASYDTARNDGGTKDGALARLKPTVIVADECHLTKSPTARRTLAMHRLSRSAAVFIALSGTPIAHNVGDLHPVLQHLSPNAWPSKERWIERYCTSIQGDYSSRIIGINKHTEDEFRLALLGQHRRVAKADVLTELPPKVYSVRSIPIPPEYRKTYDEFEGQMLAELPDGQEVSVFDALSQLSILSKLACGSADVDITWGPEEDENGELKRHIHLELKLPSWKVEALLDILAERENESVVVFAPSRQLVMLAGAQAEKAGRRVGYVVGGQTPKDRTDTIRKFQAGDLDLMCATTGAGGVGITLTAARCVVFLQRPWSIVESLQAEDRCHRIGSEKHDSIDIIDIIAQNTVESRVRDVIREKAELLADVVQDPRILAEILGGDRVITERKAG